jgi:hypothetical protein
MRHEVALGDAKALRVFGASSIHASGPACRNSGARATSERCRLGRVCGGGELFGAFGGVGVVALLDGDRPGDEFSDGLVAGLVVHDLKDAPVADFAASAMVRNSKPSSASDSASR